MNIKEICERVENGERICVYDEKEFEKHKNENGVFEIYCEIKQQIENAKVFAAEGSNISVKNCVVITSRDSKVQAVGQSSILSRSGTITSFDRCEVWATNLHCKVTAHNNSKIHSRNGIIIASDDTQVDATGNSMIRAWGRSQINAFHNSIVMIHDADAKVHLYDHAIARKCCDSENIFIHEPFFGHVYSQHVIAPKNFIVYKKLQHNKIATLCIPKGTHFQAEHGDKHRAEQAIVMAIEDRNGNPCEIGYSKYEYDFTYEVEKTIKPAKPYDTRLNECSSGIHFHLRKEEAMDYE
jgi:hypothetical protein